MNADENNNKIEIIHKVSVKFVLVDIFNND